MIDFRDPKIEASIRNHIASLRVQSDAGSWMSETPSNLESVINEIDRLRNEIRDLYVRAVKEENPLSMDIISLLGKDIAIESIQALSKNR